MHRHVHDGTAHLHLHSHARSSTHEHIHRVWDVRRALGFGLAHGLAGSAAVLVLVVASAQTTAAQAAYIVTFGLGTIAGMLSVAFLLGALVRAASRRGEVLATVLHLGSALASVAVGLLLGTRIVTALIS
jgi:sulfite exporter TauE/SafE